MPKVPKVKAARDWWPKAREGSEAIDMLEGPKVPNVPEVPEVKAAAADVVVHIGKPIEPDVPEVLCRCYRLL